MDSLLDRSVATRRGLGHLVKRVDDKKNDSWMLQYQATKYKWILMIQSSDTDRVHPLTVNWGCKSLAYVDLLKWHNGLCDMNYFFLPWSLCLFLWIKQTGYVVSVTDMIGYEDRAKLAVSVLLICSKLMLLCRLCTPLTALFHVPPASRAWRSREWRRLRLANDRTLSFAR